MSKTIRLISSPFHPPIDEACGLIFKIFLPEKDSITLLVNANTSDYKEKDGDKNLEIRQLIFSTFTPDTQQIKLDFKSKNTQEIKIDNQRIQIKLMKIENENIEGQDFLAYELFVTEIE